MPSRPRLARFFDRRLARRLVIAPLVVTLGLVAVALGPVLLLATFITDRARPAVTSRTRLLALIIGALAVETVGLLAAFVLWILSGFGRLGSLRWRWHLYRSFMGRYTSSLLTLIAWALDVPVVWRDNADLSRGPVVVIARHTSFFDAVVPAVVVSFRSRLLAHHIVTHGLRYAPCIDVVGHRIPNRFIRRTPGEGSVELFSIEKIGAVLDQGAAAIIFPEGTFRTDTRLEQAVRRLRRRDPDLAARAARLDHVLPPRPSGTYALLQGAPQADVVVCANTGFEAFGSLRDIVKRFTSDRAIIVETWRIDRSQIPEDPDGFDRWLFDQFERINAWVAAQPGVETAGSGV